MSRKKRNNAPLPPPKLEDVLGKVPDFIKGVKLASYIKGFSYKEVTIVRFSELMKDEVNNREEIARFVFDRFHQRYLLPFRMMNKNFKSGFSQMAVCCLMIETMESFQNGWSDTREIYDDQGKKIGGRIIFENFFNRYKEFDKFKGLGKNFYDNVRCGILHQAETKKGWRIGRRGALLEPATLTINSTKFRMELENALRDYCNKLKIGNEPIWRNFKTKMAYIIQNCIP